MMRYLENSNKKEKLTLKHKKLVGEGYGGECYWVYYCVYPVTILVGVKCLHFSLCVNSKPRVFTSK